MSSLTFHTVALHPVINGLKNAHAFISKAYTDIQTAGTDPVDYLSARLHPTMIDFRRQVHFFTEMAARIPSRVNPNYEELELEELDEEAGFPKVLSRIEKTIAYLEGVEVGTFEGRENKDVVLKFQERKLEAVYSGVEYVMEFAHPNIWFHIVTSYDILRMKGIELGKRDFINAAGLKAFRFVGENA